MAAVIFELGLRPGLSPCRARLLACLLKERGTPRAVDLADRIGAAAAAERLVVPFALTRGDTIELLALMNIAHGTNTRRWRRFEALWRLRDELVAAVNRRPATEVRK